MTNKNHKQRVKAHKLKLNMKPGESNDVENERSAEAIISIFSITEDQHF